MQLIKQAFKFVEANQTNNRIATREPPAAAANSERTPETRSSSRAAGARKAASSGSSERVGWRSARRAATRRALCSRATCTSRAPDPSGARARPPARSQGRRVPARGRSWGRSRPAGPGPPANRSPYARRGTWRLWHTHTYCITHVEVFL